MVGMAHQEASTPSIAGRARVGGGGPCSGVADPGKALPRVPAITTAQRCVSSAWSWATAS